MLKYFIEKETPNAGQLSPEELHTISQACLDVLKNTDPQIQWQCSYVTADKIYFMYIAPNKEMIVEYARQNGFRQMQ